MISEINNYLQELIQIALPRECIVCRDICEEVICHDCRSKMVLIENNFCKICSGALNTENENICPNCQAQAPYFTTCRSAVKYDSVSSEIVRALKYSSRLEAGDFMAKIMASQIKLNGSFDLITSVPLHPLKGAIKDFNHSEILAKEFAKIHHIPYKRIFKRVRLNKRQVRVSYEKRHENVKDIFRIIDKDFIKNKKILIVDDVTTTGATLNEASRILFLNGALPSAATFASARY